MAGEPAMREELPLRRQTQRASPDAVVTASGLAKNNHRDSHLDSDTGEMADDF